MRKACRRVWLVCMCVGGMYTVCIYVWVACMYVCMYVCVWRIRIWCSIWCTWVYVFGSYVTVKTGSFERPATQLGLVLRLGLRLGLG